MSTKFRATIAALVFLAGCGRGDAAPSSGSGSQTETPSPRPSGSTAYAARAKTILDTQLTALKADSTALIASFSSEAVVLVPDARSAHGDTTGLREAILQLSPHDRLKDVTIAKFVAGSSASAVWWSAELNLTIEANEPETTSHTSTAAVRVTELATADADWKVVAAAFATIRKPDNKADPDEIDAASTTAQGPLTQLLANPSALSDALAPSAVVFGTDAGESAWDTKTSRSLLSGWTKLALFTNGKPREVHGRDWGFALVDIDWKQPKEKQPARMAGLAIAHKVADGTWQVVAAQYTAY